ncbi:MULTISPECIES: hypothetical protein [Bifidobacterium]|jgi:DNA-binding FrmR family transcriptional regulator|uniref:Uncharacterized protein n=2 Tax=Bifidobacterium TaxID=1678 RepID=A0A087AW57_9BIFI|nr:MULTISPECIES: hypothetical protein [Bifidobacterium]KFI63007.1 hypothetical protein BCUN_0840 [Bifidobacterium cuniculi]RYQ22849.1 hypothetical protein PG2049B_1031 [Bifidobacterium pseudolongum subsp. globosum]RYQ31187.1 hypothetical protein PG2017B_0997 [Bifidobacterium pseudolongum subsp. globosum]
MDTTPMIAAIDHMLEERATLDTTDISLVTAQIAELEQALDKLTSTIEQEGREETAREAAVIAEAENELDRLNDCQEALDE